MHRGSLKRWVVRSSFALCATAALGVAPRSAQAQAAADGDAIKRARDQFNQALSLQTGGDWAGALALLKEVAAVKPTPQVRFNIALCEERLGRLVAALGDYELAASDAQVEKSDQVRQEVDSRLESLKARVPRIVVKRGENADSATISLDGVSLGGYVALEVFSRKPELFGVLGSMQGAFGAQLADVYARRIAEASSKFGPRRVHVTTSTFDPFRDAAKRLAQRLSERGVASTFTLAEGPHDQTFLREVGTLELLLFQARALNGA